MGKSYSIYFIGNLWEREVVVDTHKKIRQLRKSRCWSQEKMAERLNMSLNGYAKIERGETRLYVDKLQQIAQVLNVSISKLMDLDTEHSTTTSYKENSALPNEGDKLKLIIFYQKKLLAQQQEILARQQSEIDILNDVIALLTKGQRSALTLPHKDDTIQSD